MRITIYFSAFIEYANSREVNTTQHPRKAANPMAQSLTSRDSTPILRSNAGISLFKTEAPRRPQPVVQPVREATGAAAATSQR
jgi:hypothetical protein